MLTVPTEITDYKDKYGIEPVLFFEFEDLSKYIATRAFTFTGEGSDGSSSGSTTFSAASANFDDWGCGNGDTITIDGSDYTISSVTNNTTIVTTSSVLPAGSGLGWSIELVDMPYADYIKKGASIPIAMNLPELVNGVSTLSGLSVELTDWTGNLRADLVGSSPDLTDSNVNVYIKFNPSNTNIDNRLLIYTGKISTYKIKGDILTISIKNEEPVSGKYPENLLIDNDSLSIHTGNTAKPLQYGDFMYDTDLRFWDDADRGLAVCPVHLAPGDGSAGTWRVFIADHEMHNVSSSTDFNQDGACFFTVRDNQYVHVDLSGISVTNNSTHCYADITMDSHKTFLFKTPNTQGAANSNTNWANAVDGQESTTTTVGTGQTPLHVKQPNFDNLSENQPDISDQGAGDSVFVTIHVKLGTVTGDTHYLRYSDDNITYYSTTINAADSDTWKVINATQIQWDDLDDVSDNLEIKIEWSTAGGASVVVEDIVVGVRMQDLSSESFLYYRCEGREYSGTWGARKTSGNLIDNPIDMIESIFRDEFGTTDLDTASFDLLKTEYATASIAVCASIYEQVDWLSLLKDICEAFIIGLSYNLAGSWFIFQPKASFYDFAVSGTGMPDNQDIYSDQPTKDNTEYWQHPIKKDTISISRSQAKDKYGMVTIKYRAADSLYMADTSTGSGKEKILYNKYLGDSTSAIALRGFIDDWLQTQKYIITLETFYNAVRNEIGDVINIQHDFLNDAMLDALTNTQKWMIIAFKINWHPAVITIKAIELY